MIHLTPELLEHLYDTIRLTRPFRGWKLPPGEDVVFHVNNPEVPQGLYWYENDHHNIRMSAHKHHTLHSATMTMAHEMIHVREKMLGVRQDSCHGATFKRMASQVCRDHGFDRGQF